MTSTKLLYLEDFNLINCEAHVLEVLKENENDIVVLDQTVFYPQGGGQPYDQGTMESLSAKFNVLEVRLVDDTARHIGNSNKKTANKNQVAVGVDLGVSAFATLSNGGEILGPKPG